MYRVSDSVRLGASIWNKQIVRFFLMDAMVVFVTVDEFPVFFCSLILDELVYVFYDEFDWSSTS